MRLQVFPAVALVVAVTAGPGLADVVQAGRYTLVVTTPTADQSDPLAAVVSVTFPRESIVTVGDAVTSLLTRSGYALGQDAYSVPLSFPLPDVQRRFDTVHVRAILAALGGAAYAVQIDPASRSVSYQLRPEFVPAASLAQTQPATATLMSASTGADSPEEQR